MRAVTTLVFERVYPALLGRLFALHEDPSVLVRIQPQGTFRLVSHPGHIRPGGRVVVLNRLGFVWFTFEFEHVVYEPPHRFGEVMVRGPFRSFRHIHEFEACEGGTLVRDRLEFALPWWLGGGVAERWVAARQIRGLFRKRQEALAEILEDGSMGTPL